MSITITDPALLAQLKSARYGVDFKGPDGELLGVFSLPTMPTPTDFKLPISEAELLRRRAEPDVEIQLDEFWKQIESQNP